MTWTGKERRAPDANSLHDDVIRLIERVDNCFKAFVVVAPLLVCYQVWEHQRVSRLDNAVVIINARGSTFLTEKVGKHHAQQGCHFSPTGASGGG